MCARWSSGVGNTLGKSRREGLRIIQRASPNRKEKEERIRQERVDKLVKEAINYFLGAFKKATTILFPMTYEDDILAVNAILMERGFPVVPKDGDTVTS